MDLDAHKPRKHVQFVVGSQLRRNVDPQPLEEGEPLVPDVLAVGAAHNVVGFEAGREAKQVRAMRPHSNLQLVQGNARPHCLLGLEERELVAADDAGHSHSMLRVWIQAHRHLALRFLVFCCAGTSGRGRGGHGQGDVMVFKPDRL